MSGKRQTKKGVGSASKCLPKELLEENMHGFILEGKIHLLKKLLEEGVSVNCVNGDVGGIFIIFYNCFHF